MAPVFGIGLSNNNNNKVIASTVESMLGTDFFLHNDLHTINTAVSLANQSTIPVAKITNFGSWAPYQQPLESIKNIVEQKKQ